MNFEEVDKQLDNGKVFKAYGEITEGELMIPVYVEWYVYKIKDLYVAVNSENGATSISGKDDADLLISQTNYPEKEVVDIEDTDYSEQDFKEIFEEETCSCEEPAPFKPEYTPWSCGFCSNVLENQEWSEEEVSEDE